MSAGEFIELRDLSAGVDRIELTRSRSPCSPPRLERANAVRISAEKVPDLLSRVGIIRVLSSDQDPQPPEESGVGHNFQPCSNAQPTWCDLCGDFIWGLYKQSLRCVYCKFTCHYRCRALIKLDCSWDQGSSVDQTCFVEFSIETDTNVSFKLNTSDDMLLNSQNQAFENGLSVTEQSLLPIVEDLREPSICLAIDNCR